jgi:hypothetical protein
MNEWMIKNEWEREKFKNTNKYKTEMIKERAISIKESE